ncbi:MAG: 16S rRNA (adenine(1518)-N(6)/adenine(1519)-N(6))-dimethyltransferase RsmA [bacterium]
MIKAKKSLGQNFLKSKAAVQQILTAADISEGDIILEVGPGKGVLTESLLESGAQVIAIEKDDRLIEFLNEKFGEQIEKGQLKIIHQDILEFNNDDKVGKKLLEKPYKLVANIPYYITGALLRKFLESDNQPERMVLMLQKEVAKRIVANDKRESLLSISVKAYGEPKYIATVPARYFSPVPKVDSAILQIKNISKGFFTENKISEEKFFKTLKAGFAHKRKVLIKNLNTTPEIFQKINLSTKIRAENLSLKEWSLLSL